MATILHYVRLSKLPVLGGWENGVLAPIKRDWAVTVGLGGKKASLLDNLGNQGNLQIEIESTCLHRRLSVSIGEADMPCYLLCTPCSRHIRG